MSSSSSRRAFLRILGGSAVILAAGGGYWVATRTPTGALKPWRVDASTQSDPRVRALSYAILAPNPHNRQPWLVDLSEANVATLLVDTEKLLPHTDPFSRQVVIGLGCFLEILRIAAAEFGFEARITQFPEGDDAEKLDKRPVARIEFIKSSAKDPLFQQVLKRRTNKEPYDMARTPDRSALDAVIAAVDTPGVTTSATNKADQVAKIRDLFWRAHKIESLTPRTMQESIDLMRIGRAEIERNPDGLDLGGPFLEALKLAGVLSREKLADPTSDAFRQGLEMYRALIDATPAALWMTTADTGRARQLDVGRAWVRAQLKATEFGLSLHPLSQALQEYPEMAALYAEAKSLFGAPDGGVAQMAGRVGFGPKVSPSPRWPLSEKLVGA